MSWGRHLKILLGTFIGANVALFLLVLAMNPYGNLPNTVFSRHVVTDDNQRFQYPSLVRSGRYDSIIIGTSTSRLLDPRAFERMLGGRFANIAMNAGTAWEQVELAKLFLRHRPNPHALVVGLDYSWCTEKANSERITFRGFPAWMYDDDPWNDLSYMYNTRAMEIAGRRLATAFTGRKPRLPPDGFEIFTPPESAYDPAKVRVKIYGAGPARPPAPEVPAVKLTSAERAAIELPALPWLDDLVAGAKWRQVVLIFPPVHLTAQPPPGSMRAIVEAECKARVAEIGARHAATVIDFRFASPITSHDSNFWDPLHYRVPIARRVTDGIAAALAGERSAVSPDWRVLQPASAQISGGNDP
jgi:hypothetical protein